MKYVKRRCILIVEACRQFAGAQRGLQQTGVELGGLGAVVFGISLLPFIGDALAFMVGGIVAFVYAQGIDDAGR